MFYTVLPEAFVFNVHAPDDGSAGPKHVVTWHAY
jgi:hypothetical protein